jgi:TetR/AcrR family transcriptional regulator, cholesterol catabolism regulator
VVSIYVVDWKHLTGPRLEAALKTRRRAYEVVHGYIEAIWAEEETTADQLNARYASMLILSAINGLTGWYKRSQPDPVERIADTYAEMATALVTGYSSRVDQSNVI